MTVIAAACDGDLVWMAADTGTQVQGNVAREAAVKVRTVLVEGSKFDRALVGVTGNGALTRFSSTFLPEPGKDLDDWAADCADRFTEWALERKIVEGDQIDGKLLLGFRGRLWALLKYQAVPFHEPYAAMGSGGDLALGALAYWSRSKGDGPGEARFIVREAAAVACYFDPNCAEPITVAGI